MDTEVTTPTNECDSAYESGPDQHAISPEHHQIIPSGPQHRQENKSRRVHETRVARFVLDFQLPAGKEKSGPMFPPAKRQRTSPFISHENKRVKNIRNVITGLDLQVKRSEQKSAGEEDVIGDFSRPCSLPTVPGRMYDIPSISPATLTQSLKDSSRNVTVLDCRYPYEYEGGHIVGAKNLYSKDLALDEFPSTKQPLTSVTSSTNILVFHCEFSIERGPNMVRFLREADRSMNKAAYPALHYPEIYLMHGGYKAFWEACGTDSNTQQLCEPSSYRPMVEEGFEEEMWKYRKNDNTRKHAKFPRVSKRTNQPRRRRVLF